MFNSALSATWSAVRKPDRVLTRYAADHGIFKNERAGHPAGQPRDERLRAGDQDVGLAAQPVGAGALAQPLCRAEAPLPVCGVSASSPRDLKRPSGTSEHGLSPSRAPHEVLIPVTASVGLLAPTTNLPSASAKVLEPQGTTGEFTLWCSP